MSNKMKDLFPFDFCLDRPGRAAPPVDWHEVAEAIRRREFNRIDFCGWELIADKIDPECKSRKGNKARSVDQLSKVYWHVEHLKRGGIGYEEAVKQAAEFFATSDKNIEAQITEYAKIQKKRRTLTEELQQNVNEFERQRKIALFGSDPLAVFKNVASKSHYIVPPAPFETPRKSRSKIIGWRKKKHTTPDPTKHPPFK